MYQLIVLPTDFSEYSQMTAGMVRDLPGVKEVLLIHVTEGPGAGMRPFLGGKEVVSPRESAEHSLLAEKERLESEGIPVRTRILQSDGRDVSSHILACARKEQADLVMLGARGKGFVEGLLLGSVSSRIVRHASSDVLIIHHRGPFHPGDRVRSSSSPRALLSRVLYPTDFSKPSVQGLDRILGPGAVTELILLHVISRAESRSELNQSIHEAYGRLQDLGRMYENGATRVRLLLRFGKPSEVIADMGIREEATLIVLPRFGASDFTKSLPIGSTAEDVVKRAKVPVLLQYPDIELDISTRELRGDEFPLAGEVWTHYHQQEGDPSSDRIFGVFVEGMLVAVARCRHHPDGNEVDGVYTLDDFRGRGYARLAVERLVADCGGEDLFMHSTLSLVKFYGQFGFEPIPEDLLPPTIKARFDFAMGEMEGSDVQPMKRRADSR